MNRELNKKLAEWAGFVCLEPEYTDNTKDPPIYYEPRWEFRDKDGDVIWLAGFHPDFTESLGACIRWLVPKTREKMFMLNLSSGMLASNTTVTLYKSKEETYQGFSEEPALAFCKAVEKLIDSEVKDGN